MNQNGLDTADAAAGAFLFQNLERAKLGGICRMRAAADFHREVTNCVELDDVAIFGFEQTNGAALLGFLQRKFFADDIHVAYRGRNFSRWSKHQ